MPYKDPAKRLEAERARQRRKRAGAAEGAMEKKSTPAPMQDQPTVREVTAAVVRQINEVQASAAETVVRARTVGYLAGVLLKALEIGQIEDRLTAIEETLLKK